MVEDHGNCPSCKADLNGEKIWDYMFNALKTTGYYSGKHPLESDKEAALEADKIAAAYGATRTNGRFGLAVGIYDLEQDRTVKYRCPFCKFEWKRE